MQLRRSQSRNAKEPYGTSAHAICGTNSLASGQQSPSWGESQCGTPLWPNPDAQSRHGTARNSPVSLRDDAKWLRKDYEEISQADNEEDVEGHFPKQEGGDYEQLEYLLEDDSSFDYSMSLPNVDADSFGTVHPTESCGVVHDFGCGDELRGSILHSRQGSPGLYDHETCNSLRFTQSPAASMLSDVDEHHGGHTIKSDEGGDGRLLAFKAEETIAANSYRPPISFGGNTIAAGCMQEYENVLPMYRPYLELQPPAMQQETMAMMTTTTITTTMTTPIAFKARKKGFGGSALSPPPPSSGAGKRKASSKKATPAKRSKMGAEDSSTSAPAARKGKDNGNAKGKDIGNARTAKDHWEKKAQELLPEFEKELSHVERTNARLADHLQHQIELLPKSGYYNQRKCLVLFFCTEIMRGRVLNVEYNANGKFSSFLVTNDRDQSWKFVQGLFSVFGHSIMREHENEVYLGAKQQQCQTLHQAVGKFGMVPEIKGGGVWNKAFRGELKFVEVVSRE